VAALDREGGQDEQRVVCGVQRDRCKKRLPAHPEPPKREAEREADRKRNEGNSERVSNALATNVERVRKREDDRGEEDRSASSRLTSPRLRDHATIENLLADWRDDRRNVSARSTWSRYLGI